MTSPSPDLHGAHDLAIGLAREAGALQVREPAGDTAHAGGVPGTSARRWVVDPLDGTRNYLSGSGPWSVCIALQDGPGDHDLALAVVHDPVVGETFSTISGEGVFLDGAPVTASDRADLHKALAGLSFDPSSATN